MADSEMTRGRGDEPIPKRLFAGYDSVLRGMLPASAVTGEHAQSDGGIASAHIQVCESLQELAQALDIDASLSVSYLKAASVTAKMEFVKKLNVTARSVTIVVHANHKVGTWSVKDVRLKDNVKAPTNDDEAADFVQYYGDSFISSVTMGGEYYAVYTFHTETREEQTSLATSLKGKGIAGGLTVEGDVQVKLSEILKQSTTAWTLQEEITGIAYPQLPPQDKLVQFALDFSKQKLDAAVPTDIKVQGHEGVPGFGRKFLKVVKNRRYFMDPEDGLLQSLARLTAVRNQIDWLKRIYDRYNYTGDAALIDFERAVLKDVKEINGQIADWGIDATTTFKPPALPSLAKGEPVLQYDAPQPPAWGGAEAGPWETMSPGEAIKNRVRIQALRLFGAEYLNRIEVDYTSDKRQWSEAHGANTGGAQPRLSLEDGRFPVRFEGRAQRFVDRLKVTISDGRVTEAGGNGGTPFGWSVPEGSFVLALAGRSGSVVDQLSIVYANLKAAKMVQPL
ncbi:MAG: hypothetical protein JOZ90_05070 [Alphaproteobacteria bacterium]|nr:hypothetical protein [Alphaproteobacteria bacterium]MBV9372852.1 hypothetical protein [Alphaproteobacteria bacterium]MBV9900453.1 hypothetical protein [Alphaproteobacteria bacterium]